MKPNLLFLKATYRNGDEVLEIETNDMGGGLYFEIKTSAFSFDEIEDFIAILEDFKKRLKDENV